jgi:hypothetical protein
MIGVLARNDNLNPSANLAAGDTTVESKPDYGVDVPPDYTGVAQPANAAGWEEIYPLRERLPANDVPQAIGPYGNAWKLYRKFDSDTYVVAIRGTIDTKGSIVSDLIATSTPACVQIQAKQNPYRRLLFTLVETPQAETHLGWTRTPAPTSGRRIT